MKTIEQGSSKFSTWLGNATALPVEVVHSLFSLHLGYKREGKWKLGRLSWLDEDTKSLFYNAVLFIRVSFPFWVGLGIRWAGKNPERKEYLQTGFGWKLNGRLGALFRIQSDVASTAGVQGPNYGQGYGWEDGTK